MDDLVRMSPPELLALYRQGGVRALPCGKVKGRPFVDPGSRMAVPASKVARVLWQGKVINCAEGKAKNKFFGLRVIEGELYYGSSWLDGGPALILDYQRTSHVYAKYRDEIREVAPGLFLGLMYERTCPQPTFTMFFGLESIGGCP